MKLIYIFLLVVVIVLSGCSGRAPQTSPEPESTFPPDTETTPVQPSDNNASEEPDTVSQVILKYWEAMNNYDLERALSYYEKQYREGEEEEVKGDITRLKQFSVTLTVADISEPVLIEEDKARCEIILSTPIGDRNLVYLLERIDGEWKIYLEAQPEEFLEAEQFITEFLAKYGESQRIDIIINAEQKQDIQRATTEYVIDDLIELGEIVELRLGFYSLPSE
jgi:hypothetical protein